MNLIEQIKQSLEIEDITRNPTAIEVAEHERFLRLERVTIADLEQFVRLYAPDNKLRMWPGMDVNIGVPGGVRVPYMLDELLYRINQGRIEPWEAHIEYERIHPFTDGNGRSGRMLWYWMMHDRGDSRADLGFLRAFYYQTLRHAP